MDFSLHRANEIRSNVARHFRFFREIIISISSTCLGNVLQYLEWVHKEVQVITRACEGDNVLINWLGVQYVVIALGPVLIFCNFYDGSVIRTGAKCNNPDICMTQTS